MGLRLADTPQGLARRLDALILAEGALAVLMQQVLVRRAFRRKGIAVVALLLGGPADLFGRGGAVFRHVISFHPEIWAQRHKTKMAGRAQVVNTL